MGYKKAEEILPMEIIALIQDYVDGECIYIPRKKGARKAWGHRTGIRRELEERNAAIFADYSCGMTKNQLTDRYCLSGKSIERIIKKIKNEYRV